MPPTNLTRKEQLSAHYQSIKLAREKIEAIAIRRLPETEDELTLLTPQKYRNLVLIRSIWHDLTKNRPKPDYSLNPSEKHQIKLKHFGDTAQPPFLLMGTKPKFHHPPAD
jgi:hypothetical protein